MTIDEYVAKLEHQVMKFDEVFVKDVKDWSPSDKLYVYLHKIQLEHMNRFSYDLELVNRNMKFIRAQTS